MFDENQLKAILLDQLSKHFLIMISILWNNWGNVMKKV